MMRIGEQLLHYHDLIAGIVAALEARDPYTACHSMRVAEMSQQLCGFLNLSPDESAVIHIAAHLHDIGKIGIDDSVLRKTERLTDSEWAVIKKHSVIGYTILGKVECFSEVADIVLHHHERWNGSGYPSGIAGETIPYGSRIIAVADSIDAMMSSRVYRGSMTSDGCRREISRNSGVMYDPTIANATLGNWKEIVESRNDFNVASVDKLCNVFGD